MKYEGTATSRRGQRESFKSKATPTSGAPFIRAAATSRYPKATAELLKAFGLSSLLVPEMRERRPKRHLFELLPPECVRNIAEKLFEGLGVSIGGHAAVTWPSRASYLSVLGVALLSREMALEVRRLAWRVRSCSCIMERRH